MRIQSSSSLMVERPFSSSLTKGRYGVKPHVLYSHAAQIFIKHYMTPLISRHWTSTQDAFSNDALTFLTDLGKPSREQLTLQTDLRRLQSTHRLDEEEFDNQKQVLQAELQSEVSPITASRRVWETMWSAFSFLLFMHCLLPLGNVLCNRCFSRLLLI